MMKRVLNLNALGPTIAAACAVFGVLIPLILAVVSWLLDRIGVTHDILDTLLRVSLLVGGSLLLGLIVLVILEQIQDHYLDRQYQNSRHRKIKLTDDWYECQYCGHQKLRAGAQRCPVCGNRLIEFNAGRNGLYLEGDETVLPGPLPHQAALHGQF
jgi:hypothetical protein